MYREADDDQWEQHANRKFSIDLNEVIDEQLELVENKLDYSTIARNIVGLLSEEDLAQLALEGLSNRVGSHVRRLRKPAPRKTKGSARWDQVKGMRDRLEEHWVNTGHGVKPLLSCNAYDMEGAVAYYTEQGNAYHARAKQYDQILFRLKSQREESVAGLDGDMVRRILNV